MANSGGEEEDWGSADEEEREEGDDDLVEEEPWDPVTARNPFCVCPRGTRRTHLGHALMEPQE
jgi:hypothetical protein